MVQFHPLLITNGRIITPLRQIDYGELLIEGGVITKCGPVGTVARTENMEIIDVQRSYVSPGFIDLHLHGAWGGDVMSGSLPDMAKMAQGLVKGGVTAFLPTTLSGSLADITKVVACIEQAMGQKLGGAKIIGAHLEGPYFSLQQKGAQNEKFIITPDPQDYLPILDRFPVIKRLSAAPELPGALELGRQLRKRGIVASIAHTDASYQEVLQAIENGYTHVTHIFSGMSSVQRVQAYRVSGVVESALLLDELTTEMIADGHHLPPSLMKLVLKTKGLDRVCLVTDSMAAAGLGEGKYQLGGLDVIVEAEIPDVFEIPTQEGNFVAKLADRSAFASSVATMDQLVRNMVKMVGLNVADAVKLATFNPAKMQGLAGVMGEIVEGRKADLTIFDSDINIQMTLVDGQIVYQKSQRQSKMV